MFLCFVYLVENTEWFSLKHFSKPIRLFLTQSTEARATAGLIGARFAWCRAGALIVTGFAAHSALGCALVLANRCRFLEDVQASCESFQGFAYLLCIVEGLGFLEDVLAAEETIQGLFDLLGGVEGLGLLEDVLAAEETIQGFLDLLSTRNPVRIQWAGACVVHVVDGAVADRADHYYKFGV